MREIYSLSFLQPEMMFNDSNDIRTLAMERPPGVVQAEGADLARSAARQRSAQLNAVMLAQQFGHPIHEHADLCRQVAVLRIDDVQR